MKAAAPLGGQCWPLGDVKRRTVLNARTALLTLSAVKKLFIRIFTYFSLPSRYCDLNDFPGIIYDHEGTGESDPGDPMVSKEILFTNWVEDVRAVIDQLTEGPIVLVGCSMGGNYKLINNSRDFLPTWQSIDFQMQSDVHDSHNFSQKVKLLI